MIGGLMFAEQDLSAEHLFKCDKVSGAAPCRNFLSSGLP
jgi:hypothetical protein